MAQAPRRAAARRTSPAAPKSAHDGTVAVPAAARQGSRSKAAVRPPAQSSLIVIGADDADEFGGDGTVEVNLVGQVYNVVPPKSGTAMRIAWLAADKNADPDIVFQALDAWLDKAFGDQADEVRHRIYEDEEDPLDFGHLMTLMEKLIEVQNGGLPTTRR